ARVVGARPLAAWTMGLLGLAAGAWLHWSLHLDHLVATAWLPWALAAAHRLVEAPSRRRAAALALVLAPWWLGGNAQYVYFGALAVAGYAVARVVAHRRGAGRALAGIGAAAPTAALLAAPRLAPTLRP